MCLTVHFPGHLHIAEQPVPVLSAIAGCLSGFCKPSALFLFQLLSSAVPHWERDVPAMPGSLPVFSRSHHCSAKDRYICRYPAAIRRNKAARRSSAHASGSFHNDCEQLFSPSKGRSSQSSFSLRHTRLLVNYDFHIFFPDICTLKERHLRNFASGKDFADHPSSRIHGLFSFQTSKLSILVILPSPINSCSIFSAM